MTIKVAPGFIDLIELASQRVTEVGWNVVTEAVELSAQLHTDAMNELLTSICEEPPAVKEKVEIAARTELQPLEGEFDRPKPVGALYSYEAGYPLERGGHAFGTGRESRVEMTVAEANKFTLQGLTADATWMKRRILHSVFWNAARSFEDKKVGTVPCVPLANGDAQEYVLRNGDSATDNHYLFQAVAIDNSNNPFPAIFTELLEHPENSGDPVVYVATNLKASIEALSGFVKNENPAIVPGSGTDTLARLPVIPFGDKVLGMVDGCWIVEWFDMPSGYMFAHCEGDDPFIGWRQHSAPELRGFFVESYSDGGVLQATGMIRYSGFSVRKRTKALVMLIGAGAYTPPAVYNMAWLPQ
ncbi:MAG: hypothetical protein JXO22_06450 [Phycisphaerae bacterium]|nr:hypothetical protein [Phycisphaerae bacterium]